MVRFKKGIIFLLLVISILTSLLSLSVFADRDTYYPCVNDDDCSFVLNSEPSYCSPSLFTCFLSDNLPPTSPSPSPAAPAASAPSPSYSTSASPTSSRFSTSSPADIPASDFPELNEQLTPDEPATEPTIIDDELIQLQLTLQLLQEQSASLEDRLSATESGTITLSQSFQSLHSQLSDIQSSLSQLSRKIAALESDQQQSRQSISKEVSGVATGLASLQTNLNSAQKTLNTVKGELDNQSSRTSWLTVLFIALLTIATALGLYYYINRQNDQTPEIDEQIARYITRHIKAGKKFPQVKESLLKAGWSESDINWAYKETLKKNYKSYLLRTNPFASYSASSNSSSPDTSSTSAATPPSSLPNTPSPSSSPAASYSSTGNRKSSSNSSALPSSTTASGRRKALTIGIVGFILTFGIFFAIQNSTGHAIYFNNQDELNSAVRSALEEKAESNPFYDNLEYALICLQVLDDTKSVSYKVSKNPFGHEIEPAAIPCDQDINYDLSLKFSSFQAFDLLINNFNCDNARRVHSPNIRDQTRGVYVLPSRLVMPGFLKNPSTNYQPYCPIINECLTPAEISAIAIDC